MFQRNEKLEQTQKTNSETTCRSYIFLLHLCSLHSWMSWAPIFTLFAIVQEGQFITILSLFTVTKTLVLECRSGKYSLLDCSHPAHQCGFFPSIYKTSPKDSLVFFSIQRNEHQDLAFHGLKSDRAEHTYQLSMVCISEIFASIILWHQQAFLGVQGMQAQGLREAKPLTEIAALHPVLRPLLVAVCNPAIFSKPWMSLALLKWNGIFF